MSDAPAEKDVILIVDDTSTNLEVLFDFLVDSGFKVLVAEDGESAIQKVEYASPDLILLDVLMPGMDGFETCRRLKANESTKDISVIFMTALSETVHKVRGLHLGAVDYVTKPLQHAEVLARINIHLSLRKLTKKLQEQNLLLEQEIQERKRVELALSQAKDELELRVIERTAELISSNQQLQLELDNRQMVERMKDEFVAVISHELRTPLTSIHGSLGMLAGGLVESTSERGKRLLEIAVDSTERLVRLTNDILDIKRIESGEVRLAKQICNAADLITEAVDLMQSMAEKAGVVIEVSTISLQLWADPDRIIQTLTNLLSNAIKFSPQGNSIWLTAQRQGEQVLFQVRDRGRGIPADQLETIFERFQQVDASDSRNNEGTGLGLAICRSILQQHAGRIWVESTLGEGSAFYFTLPISKIELIYSTSKNRGGGSNHGNQTHSGD